MPIITVEPPDADLAIELPSPDYTTTYPRIEGPYTLPWWAQQVVEDNYRQSAFVGRTVRIYRLRHVYVCHEGLVFDADGRLIVPTGAQITNETITEAHRGVQQALFDGTLADQPGPMVLCKRPTAFNYGHWMIDMLPLADIALRALDADTAARVGFLLLRTHGAMDQVMTDSLARLGIAPDRLVWTDYAPRFCHELYLVLGMSDHGKYVSPHVIDCHDRLAQGLPGRGWQRLFITRQGGHHRRLRNEAELMEIAEQAGFQPFDPGSVPLAEQIRAFKDARHIIGATGAALTNIVYAPRGAQVTLMTPQSMPDTFYWLLCQVRGQRYSDQRCEEVGEMPGPDQPPWARDTVMDPDRFRTALAAFD
jgi:capsular polysaccharide biosynthesis protein